jgi:hypothetical protein
MRFSSHAQTKPAPLSGIFLKKKPPSKTIETASLQENRI